jgi:hypothetical protein
MIGLDVRLGKPHSRDGPVKWRVPICSRRLPLLCQDSGSFSGEIDGTGSGDVTSETARAYGH